MWVFWGQIAWAWTGAFAKLGKATISIVISVYPSVRIFIKLDIRLFFKNLLRKFMLHDNLTRISGTLHETNRQLWSYLAQFFLEWEMFQTKFVQNIKTHVLCSITFFRKSCRLGDNVEKIL